MPDNYGVGAEPQMDVPPSQVQDLSEDVDDEDFADPDNLVQDATSGDPSEPLEERFPAETSWVAWVCLPERIVDHHQVRHKPLSGTVVTDTPAVDPFGRAEYVAQNVVPPSPGWTGSVPDIIQQTSSPSLLLRLHGYGVRIAHRVNAPKLISYGGQVAVLKSEKISESTMGVSDDVVMYRTEWDLLYLIPGNTATIPLPADPLLGIDGQ